MAHGGSCEPSESHAAKLAPENCLKGGRGHLIVAYGGGGGGYTGEQNDWAVGVLDDDDLNEDPPGALGPARPAQAPAAATPRARNHHLQQPDASVCAYRYVYPR